MPEKSTCINRQRPGKGGGTGSDPIARFSGLVSLIQRAPEVLSREERLQEFLMPVIPRMGERILRLQCLDTIE
jgi:hypothetical protein